MSICRRYQKSRGDAEDVLQESLVKIFSKLKSFDTKRGSFSSWSNTVVINENLMAIRKSKSDVDIVNIDTASLEFYSEKDVVFDLSTDQLLRIVQSLPKGYSTIFNLYVVEGYTHKEIAEILHISIGTSKSQLHKAKVLIRKTIKDASNYQVA